MKKLIPYIDVWLRIPFGNGTMSALTMRIIAYVCENEIFTSFTFIYFAHLSPVAVQVSRIIYIGHTRQRQSTSNVSSHLSFSRVQEFYGPIAATLWSLLLWFRLIASDPCPPTARRCCFKQYWNEIWQCSKGHVVLLNTSLYQPPPSGCHGLRKIPEHMRPQYVALKGLASTVFSSISC